MLQRPAFLFIFNSVKKDYRMKIFLTIVCGFICLQALFAQQFPLSFTPDWKAGERYSIELKDSTIDISPDGKIKNEYTSVVYIIDVQAISDSGYIVKTLMNDPLDPFDESIPENMSEDVDWMNPPQLPKTMETQFLISKDCQTIKVHNLALLKEKLINKKKKFLKQYEGDEYALQSMEDLYNEAIENGTSEEYLIDEVKRGLHLFLFQYNFVLESATDTVLILEKYINPFNPGEKIDILMKKYLVSGNPLILREEILFDKSIIGETIENIRAAFASGDSEKEQAQAAVFEMKNYLTGEVSAVNKINDLKSYIRFDLFGGSFESFIKVTIQKLAF